jgi:hypothetical protein
MERKILKPRLSKAAGTDITNEEIRMLTAWRDQGKIALIRTYASWIHNRVWDEHVDVARIEAKCKEILEGC